MILFSLKKVSFVVACLTIVLCVNAAKETYKLQVLVNPADPTYIFYLNTGSGIVTVPGATRPAGGYLITNGLIFPGGTVGKHQTSYLVDKHGNPLSAANSIGMFEAFEKMLTTVDFSNFPPAGTLTNMSEWTLNFNEECYNAPNSIYVLGLGRTGILAPGNIVFSFILGMIGGTGCNAHDNSVVAKAYFAPDGMSTLIKIKFDKEIKYN